MMKNLFAIIAFLFSFHAFKSQEKPDSALEKINKYLYENPDKAIEEGKKLIANESDIDKKIRYHLFLSRAFTAKRNTDESLKTLLEAQKLLQNSNNLRSKIDVLIIIAIQYQQMELYSKCFETLDEAEKLCAELQPQFNLQKNSWLGKSNAVKGIIYKSQENNEIALEKLFKSVGFFEKSEQNTQNINNLSVVYYNIAYSYFNLNNTQKAEIYFLKSLEYAKKSNAKSLQAFALKGLAENYTSQNNHQKALELLKEARKKSQNIGDLSLNEGIYKGLAENYLSIGNFNLYLQNNDAYKKNQFERGQSELKSIDSFIENIDQRHQYEQKQIDRKNGFINLFSILGSLIISLFLSWKIFRKNRNNKVKLEKIKELITK